MTEVKNDEVRQLSLPVWQYLSHTCVGTPSLDAKKSSQLQRYPNSLLSETYLVKSGVS